MTTGGVVHSINISDGGVPKHPIGACLVREGGLEGDRQRDRRYHGGPDRAVCLYSHELIEALQQEGHPIVPGAIGENLTLAGVEWSSVVPGVTLRVGDVELLVTSYTAPCRNIAAAFLDGRFVRVSQKVHAGWSRVYARVTRAGAVRTGDSVVVSS
jgi:MOSC domain-containing protein YiiM